MARVVASARQRRWSGCVTLGGMTGVVIAVGLRVSVSEFESASEPVIVDGATRVEADSVKW